MSHDIDPTAPSASLSATPRREFLGQIAASAIVLAGAACSTPAAAMSSAAAPQPSTSLAGASRAAGRSQAAVWDDSWFARVHAVKHRAVFDSPDFEDGLALSHATGYVRAMYDALGAEPADVRTVLVFRHRAVPMIFADAMWTKYGIGEERKIKESGSESWASHNPFLGGAARRGGNASGSGSGSRGANAGGAAGATADADRLQNTIPSLLAHGHVVLGCDKATRGYADVIAKATKGDANAIYDELRANLVPGVILQPTGVYAVHRAQEAGCTFIKST